MKIRIYSSLLAVEHDSPLKQWKRVERHVQGVHIDVADGQFVPQKTVFTPALTRMLKTRKTKDVHFMTKHPERKIAAYVAAGADEADIHIETLASPGRTLLALRRRFPKLVIRLAMNATTPASRVVPFLPLVHGILCMTQARPGKSGEQFVMSVLKKIKTLGAHAPRLPIAVDGGINPRTARLARKAGATILVSGSHIFNARDPHAAVKQITKK